MNTVYRVFFALHNFHHSANSFHFEFAQTQLCIKGERGKIKRANISQYRNPQKTLILIYVNVYTVLVLLIITGALP